MLLINSKAMINYLRNNNSLKVKNYPTKEEFKALLLNINPNSLVNKYSKKTWIEYFISHQKSTLRQISIIYNSGKYIDEELRSYLLELEQTFFLKEDYAFTSLLTNKLNLEEYDIVFYDYFELIKKIDAYFDNKLKKFLKSNRPTNGKVNSVKITGHGP
jgi:hypothetical protein